MYKGIKHAGNVVISNHATKNMSRDTQFSFIIKLGALTKIAHLRHTLQQQFVLRLFSKLAHSFVANELLTFSINAKFGLKNYIP